MLAFKTSASKGVINNLNGGGHTFSCSRKLYEVSWLNNWALLQQINWQTGALLTQTSSSSSRKLFGSSKSPDARLQKSRNQSADEAAALTGGKTHSWDTFPA